jgi:uncharacterized membrane protein
MMSAQAQTTGSPILTRIVGFILLALLALLLDIRNEAPGTVGFDLLSTGTAALAVPLESVEAVP